MRKPATLCPQSGSGQKVRLTSEGPAPVTHSAVTFCEELPVTQRNSFHGRDRDRKKDPSGHPASRLTASSFSNLSDYLCFYPHPPLPHSPPPHTPPHTPPALLRVRSPHVPVSADHLLIDSKASLAHHLWPCGSLCSPYRIHSCVFRFPF